MPPQVSKSILEFAASESKALPEVVVVLVLPVVLEPVPVPVLELVVVPSDPPPPQAATLRTTERIELLTRMRSFMMVFQYIELGRMIGNRSLVGKVARNMQIIGEWHGRGSKEIFCIIARDSPPKIQGCRTSV